MDSLNISKSVNLETDHDHMLNMPFLLSCRID